MLGNKEGRSEINQNVSEQVAWEKNKKDETFSFHKQGKRAIGTPPNAVLIETDPKILWT